MLVAYAGATLGKTVVLPWCCGGLALKVKIKSTRTNMHGDMVITGCAPLVVFAYDAAFGIWVNTFEGTYKDAHKSAYKDMHGHTVAI